MDPNSGLILHRKRGKQLEEKMTFLKVRKYFREYSQTTGIQGLHYLTDKRSKTEKIIWSIILLISLSGCFWMIYEILKKYENSPIVIGLANEPGFIRQIPFPAVTICPITKVSNSKFNYEDIKLKLEKNISLTDKERRMLYYTRFMCPKYASLYRENTNYTLNAEGILDVIKEVAPTRPIFRCTFVGRNDDCTNMFTPILTSQGICYSFNVMDRNEVFQKQVFHYKDFHQVGRNSSVFDGESGYIGKLGPDTYPKRALIAGTLNGLYLHLVHSRKEINEFCDPRMEGYTMRLHHPAETFQRHENYYFLSNEKISLVSVTPELIRTPEKIKNYNVEKRKCYLKGEKRLKYFQIYTQSNCDFECLTNITLSKCRCVDFLFPRMNGSEFICTSKFKRCIQDAKQYLYREQFESNEANYYFGCNCLPLCTELKYNLDISQVDFRKNDRQGKSMAYSDEFIDTFLYVNFKSSSFSVLERNELYGTTDLISNFGGLLGLFTGFSFISLAEIIYFLTLRILCNMRLYGQWSGPPA